MSGSPQDPDDDRTDGRDALRDANGRRVAAASVPGDRAAPQDRAFPADLAVLDDLVATGFAGEVGIRFTDVGDAGCAAVARFGPRHRAPNGRVHAGALVALADTACGNATILRLGGRATGFATVDMHVQFLRSPRTPTVECRARLVHDGRRTHVWEAELRERPDPTEAAAAPQGRLVGLFRCTQLLLEGEAREAARLPQPTPDRAVPAPTTWRYVTADVFTDRRFAGNPLAVLPDARRLDADTMRAITREFGYSETVFVTGREAGSDPPRFDVRIFTPSREIPFAGHPIIGTAAVLEHVGLLTPADTHLELVAPGGRVPVRRRTGGGFAFRPPSEPGPLEAIAPTAALLDAVGLEPGDLHPELPVLGFAAGVTYSIVPLASPGAVSRAVLDVAAWRRGVAGTAAPEIYLAHLGEDGVVRARMFAPGHGIEEDPATGSAAAALGGYLRAQGWGPGVWRIEQGAEVGRPSRIDLALVEEPDGRLAIEIGGAALVVTEGCLHGPRAAAPPT